MKKQLTKAYNADTFRQQGHELIDLLADHLKNMQQNPNTPAIPWQTPNDALEFWQNYRLDDGNPINLFKEILQHSTHVHHPNYMGHQVSPPVPISALAGLVSDLLNNGMAVYEMGIASTPIEKVVIQILAQQIGYAQNADGFLTSGGTLGNLTALLAARQTQVQGDVWNDGLQNQHLAVMVSEEAHYCVDRACRIMGLGQDGVIKVPVDKQFRIKTDMLETLYQDAKSKGKKVIAMVASVCSTSTGMYDNLEAVADFCEQHQLWLHADGAHGGGAIFSEKYKELLKGLERVDSVVIDLHKMLMMPALNTALIFKNKENSYRTFAQKAQYLLEDSGDEIWYNLGHRTFECTKNMMGTKFFVAWHLHGPQLFDEYVTTLYDLGKTFADKVKAHPNFELALEPHSNIVCFKYTNDAVNDDALEKINQQIRQALLDGGTFYIVQTRLKGKFYLRVTIMSPFSDAKVIETLLHKITEIADKLLNVNA